MSFYKEQLAGETINMISLQHRSWSVVRGEDGSGTGPTGEWTLMDTFGCLCDEMRDATLRVDKQLRLDICERIERGELFCADVGLEMEDVEIARQWRGYRHGFISWHLETPRYKMDFLKLTAYV